MNNEFIELTCVKSYIGKILISKTHITSVFKVHDDNKKCLGTGIETVTGPEGGLLVLEDYETVKAHLVVPK